MQQPRNRWLDITDNAPLTVGRDGQPIAANSSNYSVWAPATCRANYPKRYQAMVDVLRSAMGDPEYLAELESVGEKSKLEYLDPAALQKVAEDSDAEIRGILERDPAAFTSSS